MRPCVRWRQAGGLLVRLPRLVHGPLLGLGLVLLLLAPLRAHVGAQHCVARFVPRERRLHPDHQQPIEAGVDLAEAPAHRARLLGRPLARVDLAHQPPKLVHVMNGAGEVGRRQQCGVRREEVLAPHGAVAPAALVVGALAEPELLLDELTVGRSVRLAGRAHRLQHLEQQWMARLAGGHQRAGDEVVRQGVATGVDRLPLVHRLLEDLKHRALQQTVELPEALDVRVGEHAAEGMEHQVHRHLSALLVRGQRVVRLLEPRVAVLDESRHRPLVPHPVGPSLVVLHPRVSQLVLVLQHRRLAQPRNLVQGLRARAGLQALDAQGRSLHVECPASPVLLSALRQDEKGQAQAHRQRGGQHEMFGALFGCATPKKTAGGCYSWRRALFNLSLHVGP
eukprot:scaffold20356_cov125-Isochrysis_galbana.AAC.3